MSKELNEMECELNPWEEVAEEYINIKDVYSRIEKNGRRCRMNINKSERKRLKLRKKWKILKHRETKSCNGYRTLQWLFVE